MKKIIDFFRNLFTCKHTPEEKKPEHEHSWKELFKYADSKKGEYKTFYQCDICEAQKTE